MRTKYPVLLVAGMGGLFTVVNLASAQGWTKTSASAQPWKALASSADGSKLVAGGYVKLESLFGYYIVGSIYTSADSGVNWTATGATNNSWSSVASSADGTKLVAVTGVIHINFFNGEQIGGQIYTSPDSGATWTPTSAPTNRWSSVASSADGTKLVAAVGGRTYYSNTGERIAEPGPIYTSPDSGGTWTQTSAPSNAWSSVASSADGTKLVAVVRKYDINTGESIGGPIYTSSDSGATWRQTSAPTNFWSSVASSADGTKLVVVAGTYDINTGNYLGGPGLIYTSTDSGASWTPTSAPRNSWSSVASSADGTKLVAAAADEGGGFIYSSTDSGATWKTTTSLAANWTSVVSSADGNKLVAATSDGIYISPYLGPWRLTSAPTTNWTSVASSADGTKIVAAASSDGIYTSPDSGSTWMKTTAPINNWKLVASSADGTKVAAAVSYLSFERLTGKNVDSAIYTSADSGATWKKSGVPSQWWSAIASSADGTKLVAAVGLTYNFNYDYCCGGGPIYTLADSGATWTQTSAPSKTWLSVASSADGTKIVAAASYDGIYTSADSGATWSQTTVPTNSWTSVASSADGTKLVAVGSQTYDGITGNYIGGRIYTSPNSGATWTQTSAPTKSWSSVASSADGIKLVAVVLGNSIYTSPDSGTTWLEANAPAESWQMVVSSADGNKLVAVAAGHIYSLQFPAPPPPVPPSPRLSISRSGLSLGLSWQVPSTSFALQQNSDLASTNWTNAPTPPTLNLTNLHYRVTVSPSVGSRFYRLKQQ